MNSAQISGHYLLLQGSTPVYVDRQGGKWLDNLWAIDAREHLTSIADFHIASPFVPIEQADEHMSAIDSDPLLSRIHFIELPHTGSRAKALIQLPRTIIAMWAAIGRADIVHMGIVGWPYPLGWLGLPMASLRGKKTIVVVESAPWRNASAGDASVFQRLQAWIYELLGRQVVRHCALRFFTTGSYRRSFCGDRLDNAHIVQATWIPEDQIIGDAQLEAVTARPLATSAKVRMAFFGRLVTEKGVLFLLDAMAAMGDQGSIELDIYGEGPEESSIKQALSTNPRLANVRFRGTLSYGSALFNRLREYDYLVVPSLSDEQPRIVYDAYSQGVPVIASDTEGLRQCVQEGYTGAFFKPGAIHELTQMASTLASSDGRARRIQWARNAVAVARRMTHPAMHASRAQLIADFIKEKQETD
ncbi:MAG: glycosyltransferase [Acidovorax sp.]